MRLTYTYLLPATTDCIRYLPCVQIPCRETVYRAIDVVNTGRFPFTVELENATESPPPRTVVTLDPDHRSVTRSN